MIHMDEVFAYPNVLKSQVSGTFKWIYSLIALLILSMKVNSELWPLLLNFLCFILR